jgi:hypothetical protein
MGVEWFTEHEDLSGVDLERSSNRDWFKDAAIYVTAAVEIGRRQ